MKLLNQNVNPLKNDNGLVVNIHLFMNLYEYFHSICTFVFLTILFHVADLFICGKGETVLNGF